MSFMETALREWFEDLYDVTDNPIQVFNDVLMCELPNHNVVKIRFYSGNVADHYNELLVEIFHKERGKIDGMGFKFNHYAHNHKDYHVWRCDGRVDWYINLPTEDMVDEITSAIETYIRMWW